MPRVREVVSIVMLSPLEPLKLYRRFAVDEAPSGIWLLNQLPDTLQLPPASTFHEPSVANAIRALPAALRTTRPSRALMKCW